MVSRDDQRTTDADVPELVLKRVFDAPRDLVWKAYTEADRLMQWWGPKGMTMRSAKIDLRPGGAFHYCLDGPNNTEMWGRLLFREIVAPELLSFILSFSDEQGNVTRHPLSPDWPLEVLSTSTFVERDGKTELTMRAAPFNASASEIAAFESGRLGFDAGTRASFDQLDEYLKRAR